MNRRLNLSKYLGQKLKVTVTVKGYSANNVDGGVVVTNVTTDGVFLTDHANFFGADARTLAKHIGKTVNLTVTVKPYKGRLGFVMA